MPQDSKATKVRREDQVSRGIREQLVLQDSLVKLDLQDLRELQASQDPQAS